MGKNTALHAAAAGCLVALGWVASAAAQDGQSPDLRIDMSLEAVLLTRENTNNFTIIENTITGDQILGSDDYDFGWEPGADARLGAQLGSFGIAARFFGGFEWNESASATTSPIWNFPTTPPLFGLGVADIDADYDTELHTGELDLTYALSDHVKVLAGARGLFLGEDLSVNADFGANTATIDTTANTFGIGPQLGVMLSGNAPGLSRVFLDGEFRVGYLFLESDLDFDLTQQIGPAFGASGSPERESIFGEAALAARFQFSERFGVRAGYNVLFVDDIPTAVSTISAVNVLNGTIGGSSDQLLVHGARFGIVGKF